MPPRSKILDLPADVREALNERLIENGFQGYEALADWLLTAGYGISKSAVHRWGQALEEEFSGAMADARRAAELGRAMVGDDDGSGLRRATTAMAQETLLRVLMGLRKAQAAAGLDEAGGGNPANPAELAKSLSLVTRSLADLGRLGLADSKYAAEQVKQAVTEAAQRLDAAARAAGVDPATAEALGAAVRIYLPDNQRRGAGAGG